MVSSLSLVELCTDIAVVFPNRTKKLTVMRFAAFKTKNR